MRVGYYFTGDGCRRDSDGYYWITGRVDDVINPSGHRIGTAEIESALVACPQVSAEESHAQCFIVMCCSVVNNVMYESDTDIIRITLFYLLFDDVSL